MILISKLSKKSSGYFNPEKITKINDLRGDPSDISAETKALTPTVILSNPTLTSPRLVLSVPDGHKCDVRSLLNCVVSAAALRHCEAS